MTDVVTGSLQVDLKRRTTLPGDILTAAGIRPGSPLVARVEEPGRIVLESPALLLALLQDDIAAALARTTDSSARKGDDGATSFAEGPADGQLGSAPRSTRDLVAELLAERAADASLATGHNDQQDQQVEAEPESLEKDGRHHNQNSGDGSTGDDAQGDSASEMPRSRDGAA